MNPDNAPPFPTIAVDARESVSGISAILARTHGMNVVSQWLPAGDFIINDRIIVERKTARDFSLSIIDGRLFRQAARMSRSSLVCVFLIEGRDLYDPSVDMNPRAIKGAVLSLIVSWRIPVVFTDNVEDTAGALYLMIRVRQEEDRVYPRNPD